MTQQTLTRLRNLKLTGMADAVQQQLEQASTYEGLPFIERLSLLVEHEQLSREQRKQARLVKQARLKLQATVQEVDYQSARNLERSQVANLAQGEWLRRGQNLLTIGKKPRIAGNLPFLCNAAKFLDAAHQAAFIVILRRDKPAYRRLRIRRIRHCSPARRSDPPSDPRCKG